MDQIGGLRGPEHVAAAQYRVRPQKTADKRHCIVELFSPSNPSLDTILPPISSLHEFLSLFLTVPHYSILPYHFKIHIIYILQYKKGMVKDMDVKTLRYFLAVAQEGTITRAAETLRIAQPPLSRQMQLWRKSWA